MRYRFIPTVGLEPKFPDARISQWRAILSRGQYLRSAMSGQGAFGYVLGDVRLRGRHVFFLLPDEIDRVVGRHGAAVEIALRLLAAFLLQSDRLRRLFHAFGGHRQSQTATESKQCTHQCIGLRLALHAVDETAVDLDLVDLEVAQMIEAGISGAE